MIVLKILGICFLVAALVVTGFMATIFFDMTSHPSRERVELAKILWLAAAAQLQSAVLSPVVRRASGFPSDAVGTASGRAARTTPHLGRCIMVRNLLAAVALLTLGGAASAQEPPVTSIPNMFGGYNYSSGGASQPNMFGGSTFYRT
jgi:hypothetical protein